MRRILVLLVTLPLLAVAPPAEGRDLCDKFVRAKGKKWVYQGTGVKCDRMHKGLKGFLREGEQPKGFKCTRVKERGVCDKRRGKATYVFYVRPKQPKRG